MSKQNKKPIVYNFNMGIGWASSGVEYAQSYRSLMLNNIGQDARFIFTDFIKNENIEAFTKNIGFLDEQVIWLYQYFTDFKIAPCSYSFEEFEKTLPNEECQKKFFNDGVRYEYPASNFRVNALKTRGSGEFVQRVEYIVDNKLEKIDYYTYGKVFTEYYGVVEDMVVPVLITYYNEDGTVAYDEIVRNKNSVFRLKNMIFDSKEKFVAHMVESMKISEEDIVIVDRTTGIGQAIFANIGNAPVGVVVHAEHYNEKAVDDNNILWNNYYEYPFLMAKDGMFFILSTKAQEETFIKQMEKYYNVTPRTYVIPVGGITKLKYPEDYGIKRKPFSICTASRLAPEKHVDWIVKAVIAAKKVIPELTLDVFGTGGDEENLKKIIEENDASDYIRLMGHQIMDDIYVRYEAYLSASTSEGFGLSLLEAIGSGLAMIGLEVPYGNTTFIHNEENGCLLPYNNEANINETIKRLVDGIIEVFVTSDVEKMNESSYKYAEEYLTDRIEDMWKDFLIKEGWE